MVNDKGTPCRLLGYQGSSFYKVLKDNGEIVLTHNLVCLDERPCKRAFWGLNELPKKQPSCSAVPPLERPSKWPREPAVAGEEEKNNNPVMDFDDQPSAWPLQAHEATSHHRNSLPSRPLHKALGDHLENNRSSRRGPLETADETLRDHLEDDRGSRRSSSETVAWDEQEIREHDDEQPIVNTDHLVDHDTHPNLRISGRRTKDAYSRESAQRYGFLFALLGVALIAAEECEPKTLAQAKGSTNWTRWLEAMKQELSSIESNKTWVLVPRPGNRRVVGGKWVYKLKRGPNGEILRYKARWAVRGFEQEYGIDYNETFASVVKPMSYKALFAIAAALDLEIYQMDVKAAFLYDDIDEEIYVEQPPEMGDGTDLVCRLRKVLYGLKQSPRIWYNTLAAFLGELGFKPLAADLGVFSKGHLYVAIYVDDLLIAGPDLEEVNQLKKALAQRFEMSDLRECSFYLGMEIKRNRRNKTIRLSQNGLQDE